MNDFNSTIAIIALIVIGVFGYCVGAALFGGFLGGILGAFILPILVLALFSGH